MLSQFTPEQEGDVTLKDLGDLPGDVYPVGRLDKDSEGLLLLTNDRQLTHRLLHPKFEHEREYLVQVDGIPQKEDLEKLSKGVMIQHYRTKPARVKLLEKEPEVPERIPPIRVRKNIPTSWLSVSLREGKNRQVRRMTAVIGYPTLRLLRVRIEGLKLGNLQPAELKEMKQEEVYAALFKK